MTVSRATVASSGSPVKIDCGEVSCACEDGRRRTQASSEDAHLTRASAARQFAKFQTGFYADATDAVFKALGAAGDADELVESQFGLHGRDKPGYGSGRIVA